MKLQLGDNLRQLRRERELTQEELAEALGVSTQSVSRWETGGSYPDLELLPALGSYFGVSVDQLLGVTQALEERKVDGYMERFQTAISVGDIETCIAVAREGLQSFPGSFRLMNKLMYALFASGSEDGDIPDWRENRMKYDQEIVALGERLMKYCPDQEIRLEATARLGFHHCEMGRRRQGRAILDTLPPQEFCRENWNWWGLEEEEKLPHTREQIRQGCNTLRSGLYNLIEGCLLPDQALVQVYEKIFALDRLIYDGDYPFAAHLHEGLARVHARLGDGEKALEELRIAAREAAAFDGRPDLWTDVSLLMGEKTCRRTDYETADSRPLRRILGETWMAAPDFDGIRGTEDFQRILRELEA